MREDIKELLFTLYITYGTKFPYFWESHIEDMFRKIEDIDTHELSNFGYLIIHFPDNENYLVSSNFYDEYTTSTYFELTELALKLILEDVGNSNE